ncbi:MAG TPA: hypothetical protein VMH82_18505 [Myxococcota bacterium]|nr:hypothetical protein [Myxococcota bacterium]
MPASERLFPHRLGLALLVAVAVALKVALLLSSQSIADGDEAVTGLMAKHVLERGEHAVYPYGVQYGAGAGVESHLAALLFAVFGVSDLALKAAGLIVWLATLGLVGLTAARMAGAWAGASAALLYGFAPQGAEWSLKVAGGHGVAVLLAVAAVALIEWGAPPFAAAALLPLAAVAHPIVAPFCVVLAAYLLWRSRGATGRALTALSLVAVGGALWIALRPPATGVWNPAAAGFDARGLAASLPAVLDGAFAANLNARVLPPLLQLLVSIGWLAALVAMAVRSGRPRRRWLYLLAPLGVLVLVDATQLAPRHLLLLYPLGCVVLAAGLSELPRRGTLLAALVLAGAVVQVQVMFDPAVHGPDPQDRGLLRANLEEVLGALDAHGIAYVYCLDPMFQWNLVWASRERIAARWTDPVDRLPELPARVDAARRAGLRVALVERASPDSLRFVVRPLPAAAQLAAVFPPAPDESR